MEVNKINSENYESFYLDYLEGSLGENDTLELFAFLNDHPEYKVEEELITLEPTPTSLGDDFKNLLKTDVYSQAISLNNIDLFLIAQKEGQLNESQLTELSLFLQQHPELEKDQKLYASTTLQADETIVYANKKGLKQKGKIILWPYLSTAAAACAILFFWLVPNSNSYLDAVSAAQDLDYKIRQVRQNSDSDLINGDEIMENNGYESKPFQAVQVKSNPIVPQPQKMDIANNKKEVLPRDKSIKNPKLKMHDERPIEKIGIALNPETKSTNDPKTASPMNSDYVLAMKDVAPPVTRKLSEIIKTEVNLKKGEDAKGTREGTFFKLGKFEYYRNKKKKQ